jgi:hypothetical protein
MKLVMSATRRKSATSDLNPYSRDPCLTSVERELRVRCTAECRHGGRCAAWAVRGTDLCVAHGNGAPPIPRSDGVRCRAWAVRGARVCRVHGGMAPAVRAAADRRWRDVLIFERGVRQRATQLRDEYLARAALRSWVAAVVGREPAERGMAFVVDRLEAEAIAGGPPSDQDLAPYRAAADGVTLEVLSRRWRASSASIRQAVGA